MKKKKKRVLKIKNIMIAYNIITIIKYLIFNQDILLIDFKIDFIFLNIMLPLVLYSINFNLDDLVKER